MRVTERSTDTSVVVIGAGQAGLSVGYYLRRLGLDPGNEFVLLDRGPSTGGAWQFRWESLRLGSAHRINDLPGMEELGVSFDTADRHLPAKQIVADFYRQYEQHFGLQVVRPADVTKVSPTLDGFEVHFDDEVGEQSVTTQVIVNATGTWGSGFVPWYPGMNNFQGRHVHTVDYHEAEQFRDQRVVVVGRILAQFQLAELHPQGVEHQEPAHQRLADAENQLQRLVGLDQPTIPGRTPSTPPSAQLGTSPGGGGSGIQAAVARPLARPRRPTPGPRSGRSSRRRSACRAARTRR